MSFGSRQSPRRALRFLLAGPRYHTNQHFAVKGLQEAGADVSFLALYEGPTEDYSLLRPTALGDGWVFRQVLRWGLRSGRLRDDAARDFRNVWGSPPVGALWRELRRLQPDIVVVRVAAIPFFFLMLLFARMQGIKSVIYSQGPRCTRAGLAKRLGGWLLITLFDAAWMTPLEGDCVRFPPWNRHVEFIPLPTMPPDGLSSRRVSTGNGVRALTVGKFFPRKNLLLLVEAFALAAVHDATLTIVGECSSSAHRDYLRRVAAMVDEKGLRERVRILTNIPFSQMASIYDAHDLFILPSRYESLAVSVLEAMAHGLAVAGSDSKGVEYCIERGDNGFVFRTDDLDDLVGVLRRALADPALVDTMGARSLELVRERYTPRRYYQNVIAATRRRWPGWLDA